MSTAAKVKLSPFPLGSHSILHIRHIIKGIVWRVVHPNEYYPSTYDGCMAGAQSTTACAEKPKVVLGYIG